MVIKEPLIIFADSNFFIEAIFISHSAAFVIAESIATGTFELATCQLCVDDVERAILSKVKDETLLEVLIKQWGKFKTDTRLSILPNPDVATVKEIYSQYIGIMRHKADIPVLASAITMIPLPIAILSNNRKHFNDAVSRKCDIPILSCIEFIEAIPHPG